MNNASLSSKAPLRVAINGFGRIGRNVLRAWFEQQDWPYIHIVAINDVADPAILAHLLRFDSTHGRFAGQVHHVRQSLDLTLSKNLNDTLVIDYPSVVPQTVILLQEPDPERLPWRALNIDLVLECTGHFRSRHDAGRHLQAGAQRVIIGAAPFDTVDAAIVFGVNEHLLSAQTRIISSVSCTTQALVPLVTLLDESVGIESALMTEIHSMTTDQTVLDQPHRDARRARAASANIIPTTSSALGALKQVMPHMTGRIEGYSLRVPTLNVAAVDLSFVMQSPTSRDGLNLLLTQAAQGRFSRIMQVSEAPLVSCDFNHQPYSLIADLLQTMVSGRQAKVLIWYDNEWGYANRLLDLCNVIFSL